MKLSQLIVGQTEEGTLAESLSHIPSALETTGRAHLDLAQQLKHHLELPLDGFLREQRELRRSVRNSRKGATKKNGELICAFTDQHHQQIENARQLKNMHHANALKVLLTPFLTVIKKERQLIIQIRPRNSTRQNAPKWLAWRNICGKEVEK